MRVDTATPWAIGFHVFKIDVFILLFYMRKLKIENEGKCNIYE